MKVTIEVDLTPQEALELFSGSTESAVELQRQLFEAVSVEIGRKLADQWEHWPRPPWVGHPPGRDDTP